MQHLQDKSKFIFYGVEVRKLKKQFYTLGESSLAPVGSHCILELFGCPGALLNDLEFIQIAVQKAAQSANTTLLKEVSYQFKPHGVTALALLSESHISIHSWPESGYMAVDVFTCGTHTKPERACQSLIEAFQASNHSLITLHRGQFAPTMRSTIQRLDTQAPTELSA